MNDARSGLPPSASDPTFWTGDLVRLRAVEPTDWQFFRDVDAYSADVRSVDRLYPPRSDQGYREWAARQATATPQNDEFFLVIESLADRVPVGTIATNSVSRRPGRFMYGISTHRDHRRRGYARQAIQLVLRYMFGELGYHKCEVGVYAYNESSLALHDRLGFVREGVLREHEYFAGRRVDLVQFGITAPEFATRHPYDQL